MSVKTKSEDMTVMKKRQNGGKFSGVQILLILCCGILTLILFKSYEQSILESRRLMSDLSDLSLQLHMLQQESNSLKRENAELRGALRQNTNSINELKQLLSNEREKLPERRIREEEHIEKPRRGSEKAQIDAINNELKKLQAEVLNLKVEIREHYRKLLIADDSNMQNARILEKTQRELNEITKKHKKLIESFIESEKIQSQLRADLKELKEKSKDFGSHENENHKNHHREKGFSNGHESHHNWHHGKKWKHGNRKHHRKNYENIWDELASIFNQYQFEL